VLIVKDADREAVSFSENGRVVVPANPVEVVEPTGAGDAFAAGWLDAWLDSSPPDACLAAGHRLAARALTTRHDVPLPEELPG
jgi:2-dehydro-3-deoxygluconokinase